MSETVLRIMLEELRTVRLACKSCGAVTEIPIKKLTEEKFSSGKCSFCSATYRNLNERTDKPDALAAFAAAYENLERISAILKIEFVIPQIGSNEKQ